MLTNAEILELIGNGEDSSVEFKLDAVHAESFAQEIVAFANTDGGVILLGVDDSGEVAGVQRPDVEEWVTNICRQSVDPPIIPLIKKVSIGHKQLLVVTIPRSYSVVSTKRGQYFIRVGSTKQQPTTAELARLFQQRRLIAMDESPVHEAQLSDLDLSAIDRYFQRLAQSELNTDSDLLLTRELVNAGVMTETENGTFPTLAGILAFGKVPQRFFPSFEIRASAYTSSHIESHVVDEKDIQGQLSDTIGGAVSFVARNIQNRARIEDGIHRTDHPVYPLEAIREAVVNAVAHRDYLISGSAIRLFVFEDRIELYSPGALPNTMTLETMRYKQYSRNQTLVSFLTGLGYMERRGKGILRIIHLMQEHHLPPPSFALIQDELLVTLHR